uniref:UBX domain-containing protein n=1 Tax=Kalanchoe fedtschenkoi TaxID=63787 RepID=A0A7N0TLP9_KALFE
MEQSINSLTFKGSIPEAIMESKRQKKLFVVYISGVDEISDRMENATWIDNKVVESVMKYCILLHIPQGSTEAVQFSTIYPQTSVPCITVVGYNGVLIWQNEGFVSAEILQSTIDKAWLSLHLQETTASILTAALASKKSEPSSSGTSIDGHQEDVDTAKPDSMATSDPLVLDKDLGNESEVEKSTDSVNTTRQDDRAGTPLSSALEMVEEARTTGDHETPVSVEEKLLSTKDEKNKNHDQSSVACEAISSIVSREICEDNRTEDAKTEGNRKVAVPDSDDVNLNIRLPNGTSLQQKFHMTSTLKAVKAYVSENQESSTSSYDLAIPYPRRVFSDQDLSQSLSELGLSNRQALIVVPHQQASRDAGVVNFARGQITVTANASSNASEEGYFSYIRRVLSYFNPLSYISGRPNSSGSETGSEGSNRGLQDGRGGAGNPYSQYSQSQNKPESSNSNRKNKQPSNTRFGSNIHTLKHDDDDGRLDTRNPFWNGNSTQYNGNGDNEDGK